MSEPTSPLKFNPSMARRAPLAASVRMSWPSLMVSRSMANRSGSKRKFRPGICTAPDRSSPTFISGWSSATWLARNSPRIKVPRPNSITNPRAITFWADAAGPICTSLSLREGVGRRRTSIAPPTRTGTPTIWPASASISARYWFQSMKIGPTSAATSARIMAMPILRSVVCTSVLRTVAWERRPPRSTRHRIQLCAVLHYSTTRRLYTPPCISATADIGSATRMPMPFR